MGGIRIKQTEEVVLHSQRSSPWCKLYRNLEVGRTVSRHVINLLTTYTEQWVGRILRRVTCMFVVSDLQLIRSP